MKRMELPLTGQGELRKEKDLEGLSFGPINILVPINW